MIITRSPVRISFGGGGTDLPSYFEEHGGAVLSATIDKYFYSIIRKRDIDDGRIQVISSDLRVCETWENVEKMRLQHSDLAIPLAALKHFGTQPSVDIFLASEIPPGTGLGSSASVCVNVLKAFAEYLNVPVSRYEVAEQAYNIARNVMGKPVGKQDEYASVFGGLNFISFGTDGSVSVEPVCLPQPVLAALESNLMLFFTGLSHDSWDILKSQNRRTQFQPSSVVDALQEIRRLADRMLHALKRGDLRAFGEMLHEGWEAKKRVNEDISNGRIDELYAAARLHGAIGGKITGAGGGGFLLLYCEAEHQARVREALAERNVKEMAFAFDTDGARVIVNSPFVDGDDNCGPRWSFVPCGNSLFQALP
jgi:D-glycero-alpha-D-manno-heptose-7-phosphate kinase